MPMMETPSQAPVARSGSASSASANLPGRADQVVYRAYVKTVSVLSEARLTHYHQGSSLSKSSSTGQGHSGQAQVQGPSAASAAPKLDRWFNLVTPDIDVHKDDLKLFRTVSTFPNNPRKAEPSTIPPLLVAFILDTSDIPQGQALLWGKPNGVKVPIDTGLGIDKGKAREGRRGGIVLEKWTFQVRTPYTSPSSSQQQQAAPTAYRLGIIHFRALYSLIRLLPSYRLFRRLRRSNNGLKIAVKLWAPEDYTVEELPEAWDIMERGQLPLHIGLDQIVAGDPDPPPRSASDIATYQFPSLDMFGLEYMLSVQYRPDVEFHVQDLEAVLSEKMVDMDEEWFTPTMARHRQDSVGRADQVPEVAGPLLGSSSRRPSGPSPITTAGQTVHGTGSYRPSGSGGGRATPGSLGKWGALAKGMPFASPPVTSPTLGKEPPSPSSTSGAAVTARRLSGHFVPSTSPSTSLRNAPRPVLGSSKPSSIGRTSSFLSQSGRSFTHAQLASMGHTPSIPINAGVPSASQLGDTSLTFSKQSVPRSLSGRPTYLSHQSGSPIIPGSMDREGELSVGSAGPAGSLVKRYSSYSARREKLAASPVAVGSQGSSGEASLPNQGILRRTSTRASYESSSLRRSQGDSGHYSASVSASRLPQADQDDIEAFLRTLDALPQPPTVAAQSVTLSKTHLPSTSSSLSNPSNQPLSNPSDPTKSPSQISPSMQNSGSPPRPRLTRTQIDEALRKMAGSFATVSNSILGTSPQTLGGGQAPLRPYMRSAVTAPSSGLGTPASGGVGLLSASRPMSSATSSDRNVPSSQLSRRTSSGKTGSMPMGSPLAKGGYVRPPLETTARDVPTNPPTSTIDPVNTKQTPEEKPERSEELDTSEARRRDTSRSSQKGSRSLPGAGISKDSDSRPLNSAGFCPPGAQASPIPINALSPQTTGGTGTTISRRGPVLLRGGFESRDKDRDRDSPSYRSRFGVGSRDKSSVSSSPSHSPIRDFGRLALRDNMRERETIRDRAGAGFSERQAEEELDNWARSAPSAQHAHVAGHVYAQAPGPGPGQGQGQGQGSAGSGLGSTHAPIPAVGYGRYRPLGMPVVAHSQTLAQAQAQAQVQAQTQTQTLAHMQTMSGVVDADVTGGTGPSSLGAMVGERARKSQGRDEDGH